MDAPPIPCRGGREISILFTLILSAFLFGCAEVGAPPGGEVDKTGPSLIASEPANGAIDVPPGDEVTLRFSERIVQPSGKQAVFISPRQQVAPKIKWKSDYITIKFADSFSVDQTYIISLGADIRDLRNNGIDSNVVVAFSTGPTIDSGKISGHTVTDGGTVPGMLVALYDTSLFSSGEPIDSIYPTYITQSNKDGNFSFQYLPEREYRMIAFTDNNHNERFSPSREQFAVPDRSIIVGGSLPLNDIYLPITSQDTLRPRILAASYTSDKLVRVSLSNAIKLDLLRTSPANFLLKSASDSTKLYPARGFLESDTSEAKQLTFFAGPLPEGIYSAELAYDADRPSLRFDSLRVEDAKDETPPEIIRFTPSNLPIFLKDLKISMTFSEPLDTSKLSAQTFFLLDRDTNSVPVERRWSDPFHLGFTSDSLEPGMEYKFNVTEFDIADLAGNGMGDSLMTYSISLIDEDSVGSITGDIRIDIPSKEQFPAVLEFLRISSGQRFQFPASGSTFSVNLPAGKYFLSGFIDSNLNGKRDKGSIFPYEYSETIGAYPDTVAVRARFETAGIEMIFK
ncbi:MAG TPA: Ig-like domain-containing protein [candidate division Zixibacteria bacterium]|nr:Ig-like domain-containing protein [candidate division Zixibacteria bacterium]